MEINQQDEIKNTMLKILAEFNINSTEDWYSQDEEEGLELYESLKAGVLEEYNLTDNDMEELLDEILK